MELHENRTELERMLARVWDYEDPSGGKTASLPKWLFAATLAGAVICVSSPSDVGAPVMTALALAPEKPAVDKVSPQNVAEDRDTRIAERGESPAGWRVTPAAPPDGPHAQATQAEIDRPPPAPPEPIEVAEQSPPSGAATETAVEAAETPAAPAPSPVMVEQEPGPPPEAVEAAEQSPPSGAATETPVEAAETPASPAPSPVMAESEPTPQPSEALANAPLPPPRPRETLVAKSVEPAHHPHWRVEPRQASQPNVLTVLVAQLFHSHRQRPDATSR